MSALAWRDEPARLALAAVGGLDELFALEGDLGEARLAELGPPLTTARTRRLYRVATAGLDCFVKLQVAHPRDLPPGRWLSYALRPAPAVREAAALRVLGDLGIAVPEVLAAGSRGRFPTTTRAALITRAMPARIDLGSWLEAEPSAARRASAMDAAEALVARIHAAGWSLGGASYRNLLVRTDLGPTRPIGPDDLAILDQPNLARGSKRSARDARHLGRDRGRFT
ncbi:MAG: lipopolysaccharide kinase InaA family protein [Planctomycetota bacterium]|nr:lipopolysaccharide kinase InaA family protein [Planctomycetota bacterium]